MKKLLSWVLAVTMIVTFLFLGVACKQEAVTEEVAEETTEETAPAEEEVAEEEVAEEEAPAEEEYDPSTKEIYYISWLLGHPVIRTALLGALQRADELGYTLKVAGPLENDHAAAIAAIEQVIAQKPAGIITWANAPEYFPAFEAAAEAGVPMGDIHTLAFMKEHTPEGLTFTVGGDEYDMGKNLAEVLAKKVDGKGAIGISTSSFKNPNEQNIANAAIEYLAENYPDIKVLDGIEIGTEGATAESNSKVVAYILANPDMTASFVTTGAGSEIWANAFEETGRNDIYNIGMDYTLANLDLIKAGKVFGVMGQPLYEEGAASIELMDKILRGEEVDFINQLPIPAITQDDMELVDYYYGIVSSVEDKITEYFGSRYTD